MKFTTSWIKFARRILMGAHHRFVTDPEVGGFSVVDILPFNSQLNIYDTSVRDGVDRLVTSRGTDEFELNRLVNEAVGRKACPENEVEKLQFRITQLETEVQQLRDSFPDARKLWEKAHAAKIELV